MENAPNADLTLGLRVVRGPSWEWNDQDDGEGGVGTVIQIGYAGSKSPEKTVVVQWDSGRRTNYRVGYKGAHDLLVLDSGPAGVEHPGTHCDACLRHNIRGARWRCADCGNYDLCTRCYMTREHDVRHRFRRFDCAKSMGQDVGCRTTLTPIKSRGLYPGARVRRGTDWEWGDQDGNGEGTILSDNLPDSDPSGTVRVRWDHQPPLVPQATRYRVGHRGKVDLRYVTPGSGIPYFKEHLSTCSATRVVRSSEQSSVSSPCPFHVGDKVTVTLPPEILRDMLHDHGGWHNKMASLIGKVGHVHRITTNNDVRVQYNPSDLDGSDNTTLRKEKCRWTFHPAALQRIEENENRSSSINTTTPPSEGTQSRTMTSRRETSTHDNRNSPEPRNDRKSPTFRQASDVVHHVTEVVRGKQVEEVREMIRRLANQKFDRGGSLLHFCLRHSCDDVIILTLLANWGADLCPTDDRGLNLLHLAASLGRTRVCEELIRSNPNFVNTLSLEGMTSLHIASSCGHLDVVKLLIAKGSDPCSRTTSNDTPLHLACSKQRLQVAALLLTHCERTIDERNCAGKSAIETIDLARNGEKFSLDESACSDERWAKVKECLLKHNLLNSDVTIDKPFALACILAASGANVSTVTHELACARRAECLNELSRPTMSATTSGNQSAPQDARDVCRSCDEIAIVTFHPCGHVVACRVCATTMRKCFKCEAPIASKTIDGEELNTSIISSDTDAYKLQLDKIREEQLCGICMERKKDTAFFPCGHTTCNKCASKIKSCPNCRMKIEKNVQIFL